MKEFLDILTRAIHEPKRRRERDFVFGFLYIFQDMLRFASLCKICQKDASLDYLHHAMLLLLGEELIRKCGWLLDL